MEDKKLFIYALVVLFGGNITGIINSISPDYRADPFTGRQGADLQRQIDEIRADDEEYRAALAQHLEDYKEHTRWGRDVRSNTAGTLERHEAQIRELRRNLGIN